MPPELPRSLPVVGYYRFSTDRQKTNESKGSHLFQINSALQMMGGDPENLIILSDTLSGRLDTRPGFQELLSLIQSKAVWAVIVRVDRLSRDAETVARLAKMFDKSGVKLWDILKRRFIDLSNPDDRAEYQTSGVKAEYESRMLSRRGKDRRAFDRSQNRVQGGRMPYGFKRSPEGFYEPDAATWELALKRIEILLEERSTVAAARRITNELETPITSSGLSRWALSPVLRGHTPYLLDDRKRKATEIRYNTHTPLLLPALAKEVEDLLDELCHIRGKNKRNRVFALSGLMVCDRCNASAHITSTPLAAYIYCSARAKGLPCGTPISRDNTGQRSLGAGIRYDVVEEAVIRSLCDRSAQLATMAIEHSEETLPPSAEQLEIEAEIADLQMMVDRYGDRSGLLRQNIAELKGRLPQSKTVAAGSEELRSLLIRCGSNSGFWWGLSTQARKTLFKNFVKRVHLIANEIVGIELRC